MVKNVAKLGYFAPSYYHRIKCIKWKATVA